MVVEHFLEHPAQEHRLVRPMLVPFVRLTPGLVVVEIIDLDRDLRQADFFGSSPTVFTIDDLMSLTVLSGNGYHLRAAFNREFSQLANDHRLRQASEVTDFGDEFIELIIRHVVWVVAIWANRIDAHHLN